MSVTGKASRNLPRRDGIARAGVVAWSLLGVLLLTGVVLWILALFRDIFVPAALATIIIFLLNPMVTRLERRGVRRGWGTAAIYLMFIFVVMTVVSFVVPPLAQQVNQLVNNLPEITEETIDSVDQLLSEVGLSLEDVGLGALVALEPRVVGGQGIGGLAAGGETAEESSPDGEPEAAVPGAEPSPEPSPSPESSPSPERPLAGEAESEQQDSGGVPSFLEGIVSRLFVGAGEFATEALHAVVNFILAPVFAAYLLVDLPKIQKAFLHYLPPRYKQEWLPLFERSGKAVGSFFRGQLLVALIVGVLSCLAFSLIGLPFWLPIGLLAGFFNIIPLVGPFVGGAVAVVVGLVTIGPALALKAAVAMLVVQQIDNHFISPKVMGWAVRLHPVAVMVALIIGLSLAGLLGMLLAVPVLGVLKIIAVHYYETRVLGNWNYFEDPGAPETFEKVGGRPEPPSEPGVAEGDGPKTQESESKEESKDRLKPES